MQYEAVNGSGRRRVMGREKHILIICCIVFGVVLFASHLRQSEEVEAESKLRNRGAHCARRIGEDPDDIRVHGTEFSFLAVGDWGLDTSYKNEDGPRGDWNVAALKNLAAQMYTTLTSTSASFVLNLGDNFYQYGVNSVDDVRWNTTFDCVFGSLHKVQWYSMLGNHDYKGNLDYSADPANPIERNTPAQGVLAEIQRTFHKQNRNWCMPNTNYTLSVETDTFDVKIIVFDSQAILRVDPYEDSGAYKGDIIPSSEAQLEWLEQTACKLNDERKTSGKKRWIFTASHHFIVSAGVYFPTLKTNYATMFKKVEPILERCGVNVHFHGHDHVTEIIELTPKKILQVGCGSAGKVNGEVRGTQEGFDTSFEPGRYKLKLANLEQAFSSVRVQENSLHIELIGRDGEKMYSHSLSA
mmetsp:Transcript_6697/g.10570  ORF Transcript_6697/g.10570 Transcript_6697/m.10570 type:complete len:412 (+) Transcript_6697:273-1508(+)